MDKIEKISTPLSASNVDLAVLLLAPTPHLINAIIGYRKGLNQYPHVITDAGLVVEGSFKSLYHIVLGRPLPSRYSVESVARDFESQTSYNDSRIRKILPTSWVAVYSIRNRKTAAHYGPFSEQTDALFSLVGSIYLVINHFEFVRNFLAPTGIQTQIDSLNLETSLLEIINEILLFPVIPTSIIQFTKDGPTITTKTKITQQQSISLIFYALPFTKFTYSSALIDKLLKISGHPVKSLAAQISNLVTSGSLARVSDTIILTNKGIHEVQELINKIK